MMENATANFEVQKTVYAVLNIDCRRRYCTNKYYAKFCCKSCTMAGQLR